MEICIDFDGTCVTHEYPKVGNDIGAVPVLKSLVAAGHKLILFTMRSDKPEKGEYPLTDAVNWFEKNEILLFGVNENPNQNKWTTSPKAYGHLYIDDAALGCPVKYDADLSDRKFIDWYAVANILLCDGIIGLINHKDEAGSN